MLKKSRLSWALPNLRTALAALLLPLFIAACGGGGSTTTTDTATIGAAGGTVTTTDGVHITVPAGALTESVTLRIARDTTGMNAALLGVAPDPTQSVDLSPTYAMTPHGTQFSQPVELRIPIDTALANGSGALAVLRTEPGQGNWQLIPVSGVENGKVLVSIDGFSFYKVVRLVQVPAQTLNAAPVPFFIDITASIDGVGPENFNLPRSTTPYRRLYAEITSRTQNLHYAAHIVGLPASCASITLNGQAGFPTSARAEDVNGGTLGPDDAAHEPTFAQTTATTGTTTVNGYTYPTLDFAFDLNIDNAPYKRTVFNALRAANDTGATPTVAVSFNAWATCSTPVDLGGGNLIGTWKIVPGYEKAYDSFFNFHYVDDKGWVWNTVKYMVDYLPRGFITHPSDVSAPLGTAASFSTSAWPTPDGEQRIEWWRSNNDGVNWTRVRTSLVPTTDTADTYTLDNVASTDNNALFRARLCTLPRLASVAESCTDGIAARLTVLQGVIASSFNLQPRALLVRSGETASLSVVAQGTPTPALRWQARPANSTGAWSDLASGSGLTTANYTTAPLQLSDNGLQLRAVANNTAGDVPSSPVTVSVSDIDVAPTIATQPASISVAAGGDAVFAVAAHGTEALSYQWRRNGTPITGANAPVLRLSAVSSGDASGYSVQISNAAGNITSNTATLTVTSGAPADVAPSIVTQPVAVTVNAGNTATFAVGVSGTGPFSYQWLKGGQPISGATAAFHSITSAVTGDAGSYAVQVTNSVNTATSNAATLTVNANPVITAVSITSQPSPQIQLPGGSATFAVAATGTGPFTYQWLKDGAPVTGATDAVLLLSNLQASDAAAYSVTVSNSLGGVTSNAASLTVVGAPAITTQPAASSTSAGATATFSVTASGSNLRYQWTRDNVGISGASSASYTTPTLSLADNGAAYGVLVYNGAGIVFSQSAVLTVTAAPVAIGPIVLTTNSNSNQLSIFRADSSTGALTTLGTVDTGISPYKVAISPNGRFAFVSNIVSATIQPFSIDQAAGSVTAGAMRATVNPYGVAVDPLNRFVWVANYATAGTVSTFLIDATTGALTPSGSPVSSGGTLPYAVAVHPTGNFIYVVNELGGSISAYTVNQATGVPTLVGTRTGLVSPQSLVVAPNGQYLFVAEAGSSRVSSFAINGSSGALTAAGSLLIDDGFLPTAIAVHPGGQYLYVANGESDNISTLSINTATGSLTNLLTATTSQFAPVSLALNTAGTRLYVVNTASSNVTTYSVSATGDTLTALGAATAAGIAPSGIAVSP